MAIVPTMMRQYEPFDPMQTLLPMAQPTMSMQRQQVMPSTQVPVTQPYNVQSLPNNRLGQLMQRPSASVYSKPSLNPSLDYAMRGDQQGYYFVTNKGKAAKTKASKSGFIPLNPNWQYRIVNERGKNQVVASGIGEQGLQDVYSMAQRLSAEQGKKANWKVEVFDPSVGSWKVYADDDPPGKVGKILGDVALGAGVGLLGAATGGLGLAALPAAGIGGALGGGLSAAGVNVTDVALPVAATLAFPGLGPVLAPTLGSAASSVLQGRSLEDTLLRSAITAGTAGLMQGTGLGQDISSALGVGQSAAATAASQKAAEQAGNILVERSLAPLIASGAGSLASTLPDLTKTLVDLPDVTAPPTEAPLTENQIIVTGTRPAPPVPISDIVNSLGSGVISQLFPTQPTPEPEPTPDEGIVVRPPTPTTLPISESLLATAPLTTGLPDLTKTPIEPEAKNSLLDDIIKYYSLGSIGLDALGGALGLGGGGGGQAAAPYVSQLGPMPTFARGGFTPYTGDYETYGFGPEFNFFGGSTPDTPTAPILPTAPVVDMLGPNTPTYTPLI